MTTSAGGAEEMPTVSASQPRGGHAVRAGVALVLLAISGADELRPQAPAGGAGAPLDAATRRTVLTELATTIREQYADPAVAAALADTIVVRLERGEYDGVTDGDSLAGVVRALIRARVADRHFDLRRRAAAGAPSAAPRSPSPNGLAAVQVLEHDVAYLAFDALPGDDVSLDRAAETLAGLPDVRALVLDLRDNIGGSGDMVALLASHLLEPGTLLYRYHDRSGNPPGETRSRATSRTFGPGTPVFVLTSGATVSAAEALAYVLQAYGRATVVGQQTPGMANPSRTFVVAEQYLLTVPFLIFRYGHRGGTFAGVGVTPDVVVPADSALDVALEAIAGRSP